MKFLWTNNSEGPVYIHSVYSYLFTNCAEALENFVIVVMVYLIVCFFIYKLLFNGNRRLPFELLKRVKFPSHNRVLLVTAHPDDESMFFGPTIRELLNRKNCNLYLLCLSHGNYENKGNLRRNELWEACNELGIPSSNITLINATYLPDDPNTEWKIETIAKQILKKVKLLDISAIITFDRAGISYHPNHTAIFYATASLCLAQLLPKECKIYTLDTVNVVRKYISLFDLLWTFLMSTNWIILNTKEAGVVKKAMQKHSSQMKWFRWIYIIFSRYMFINSVQEINSTDIELEMQITDY